LIVRPDSSLTSYNMEFKMKLSLSVYAEIGHWLIELSIKLNEKTRSVKVKICK